MDSHADTLSSQNNGTEEMTNKKVLSNSTNTCSNGPVRQYRQRQGSLTLATTHPYKVATKRKNQSEEISLDKIKISIDDEPITDITNLQQSQAQRIAMYNARQTPLIPLITDIDCSELMDSSQQRQNNLLVNVLNLINNIDEECSFFEQFKI